MAQEETASTTHPEEAYRTRWSVSRGSTARIAVTATGDLPTGGNLPSDSNAIPGPLVEAVKRFQGRHGLDPDGRLGKGTVAELNTPLSQRVRQLKLTLERWRWVPHSFSRPPIVVNIPEFELRALDESYRTDSK